MKPKLQDRAPSTDPTTMVSSTDGRSRKHAYCFGVWRLPSEPFSDGGLYIQSSDLIWNLSNVYMFQHISRTFLHIRAIVGLEHTRQKVQKGPDIWHHIQEHQSFCHPLATLPSLSFPLLSAVPVQRSASAWWVETSSTWIHLFGWINVHQSLFLGENWKPTLTCDKGLFQNMYILHKILTILNLNSQKILRIFVLMSSPFNDLHVNAAINHCSQILRRCR